MLPVYINAEPLVHDKKGLYNLSDPSCDISETFCDASEAVYIAMRRFPQVQRHYPMHQ